MYKYIAIGVAVCIIGISAVFFPKIFRPVPQTQKELTPIRVGWQTPWATQGQLSQILQHTEILAKHGLKAEFTGFNAGGPLNEAALAKQVDVLFTADQPAATLLSKDTGWVIIGRLMYNRVLLYVPPKSPIQSPKDLRGKTVGMPFGAAAQRMALKAEKDAGLDPKTDVQNVNLDILEQSDLVKDPEAITWNELDALAGFDPLPAIFEEKGLIRPIASGRVVSVIVMSKELIKNYPSAPVDFLKSFQEAYTYYRANIATADDWFTKASQLTITPQALALAASMEPNLATNSSTIRLGFTDEDYSVLQEAADFLYDQSFIKTKVTMKDHIDTSFLESASLQ